MGSLNRGTAMACLAKVVSWGRIAAGILPVLLVATHLGAGPARADDCATVGGVITNNVCEVSGTSSPVSGSLIFDETLLIKSGGVIKVAPSGVTLTVNAGDLLVNQAGVITGGASTNCGGQVDGA